MKSHLLSRLIVAGALNAVAAIAAFGQIVEFRATLNAAQETPASTSTATGTAVLLYDVANNTFDLSVALKDLANPITGSHLHEAAAGAAGPVVTPLGEDAAYTRDGGTVTGTFSGVEYGGAPATLLSNGAYINFHSAAFPGGEIRGQLLAQPKRLYAILNAAQAGQAVNSSAYGAAAITYDPGTNEITTRLHIYNFTNTLTNSHYHEAAAGASGGVVQPLGGAAVYTRTGMSYAAVFRDQTYGGDPVKLLTGGAYLNVHSDVYPAGEIRGQVYAGDEIDVSRLVNVSARGWVGTGEQVLISGFVITGTEPLEVLLTARGPSLAPFGVATPLGNPMLALHDWTGRQVVTNDEYADGFGADDLPASGFGPTQAHEAALLLVLPPGAYTSVVTSADGAAGTALNEVYQVRLDETASMPAQVPGTVR